MNTIMIVCGKMQKLSELQAAIHALQQERERFRSQIMCWEQNPENEEEVERRFHEYEVRIQELCNNLKMLYDHNPSAEK